MNKPSKFNGKTLCETAGINRCQGTPWSKELDVKELHGAAWWRVRSGAARILFFCTPSAGATQPFRASTNAV